METNRNCTLESNLNTISIQYDRKMFNLVTSVKLGWFGKTKIPFQFGIRIEIWGNTKDSINIYDPDRRKGMQTCVSRAKENKHIQHTQMSLTYPKPEGDLCYMAETPTLKWPRRRMGLIWTASGAAVV